MVSLYKWLHSFLLIIPVDTDAIPINNKPMMIMIGKLERVKGKKNLIKIINRPVKEEKMNMLRIKDKDCLTNCFFKQRVSCKHSAND